MRSGPPLDVVIVGAGPAGLAGAIALARAGLAVQVLDRRRAPLDKACGEGLMPEAVESVSALGVRLDGARPFYGIRYLAGERVVEGRFERGTGLGVRRPILHRALLECARDCGVQLELERRVVGLEEVAPSRFRVHDESGPLDARLVVGADGLHSQLRRWAGLEGSPPKLRRFGLRRHFCVAPWSDLVEVYFGDGAEAYVTPTGKEEVGVALLFASPDEASVAGPPFEARLAAFPRLLERLAEAPATTPQRGAGPLWQRARSVVRGNLALLGDASGYVDAITGEGLALAFHQAQALASAVASGDLAAYSRAHRRHRRLPELLTRLVLALARHPALRDRVLAALESETALFERLLAVHNRALPLCQALPALGTRTLRLLPRLLFG